MCPLSNDLYPLSFIYFFSSRTLEHSSNLIFFTSRRERERERERSWVRSPKGQADGDRHSPYPLLPHRYSSSSPPLDWVRSLKGQTCGDRRSPCPLLPHRRSSSSLPPDWVRSAYSSYLFIYFPYLLVLIQLYCKNWFCFVFLVWIMWDFFESEAKRLKHWSKEMFFDPSSCVSFSFVFLCFFFYLFFFYFLF